MYYLVERYKRGRDMWIGPKWKSYRTLAAAKTAAKKKLKTLGINSALCRVDIVKVVSGFKVEYKVVPI